MFKSNYVKHPVISVKGAKGGLVKGWKNVSEVISSSSSSVVCLDFYPGVDKAEVLENVRGLGFSRIIDTDDYRISEEEFLRRYEDYITDDRVFGFICHKELVDLFDKEKLSQERKAISEAGERVLVVGVGASLFAEDAEIFYFDLARWEIQLRYRKGMPNWMTDNPKAPILTKYKIGYFIEWRLADRHKMEYFDSYSYFVDTTIRDEVKLIDAESVRIGLDEVSHQPFRMEPYFDEGIWGGQWMRRKFDLPDGPKNYAWSFDGVPEENAINLGFEGGDIKLPAIDLVLYKPHELLGEKVHGRYGAEFPIRFDLLDTMEGGNLSLQVHPLTEYIQHKFGMNYTQDESYYILDGSEDSCVYLGLKEGIDKEQMIADLKRAEKGEIIFDAEKYVNKIPAKKHDHFLIPGGTIHCSGANTMVLEISATSYIFTFKLWDWGRVGLDGIPRPVHIDHGKKNIQWDRTTGWVYENLVHQDRVISETEDLKIEKTGLHIREPIVTHRYSIRRSVDVHMNDSVHMLNLVEGERAFVESTDGSFEPFEVHYAETFIVPASVKDYRLSSPDGKEIKVICAEIR